METSIDFRQQHNSFPTSCDCQSSSYLDSYPLLHSSTVMEVSGDDIADTVLKQFHNLPAKGKLQERGSGVKEWVPLCGIVAQGWPAS
jgi:hypothetical protein